MVSLAMVSLAVVSLAVLYCVWIRSSCCLVAMTSCHEPQPDAKHEYNIHSYHSNYFQAGSPITTLLFVIKYVYYHLSQARQNNY